MSAAQDFLNKQLDKNRFTAAQQQRLDASGGSSVVNREETEAPAGAAYAKYGKMPSELDDASPNADDKTSDASSPNPAISGDKYRGFGQDSDSGRNYASGAWGSGQLDAAGLAAKYKLDTSQEGRGDGHIWGRNADGSEVYIGKASMDLASNKDLIANHSKQANEGEVDHSGIPEDLSSAGDIKGAILTEWKGGNGEAKEAEPEKERTPIEHSPEVQQAKERVAAYEDDIMSGKTSEDIFGTFETGGSNIGTDKWSNNMDRINSKYQIDLNAGAAGIGTSNSNAQAETSTKAADSFLASQKSAVKKDYNFKPSYTYGEFS